MVIKDMTLKVREKRIRKRNSVRLGLVIAILVLFTIAVGIVEGSEFGNRSFAHCDGVCNRYSEVYYSEYELDNPEYWTSYCNAMIRTQFECN